MELAERRSVATAMVLAALKTLQTSKLDHTLELSGHSNSLEAAESFPSTFGAVILEELLVDSVVIPRVKFGLTDTGELTISVLLDKSCDVFSTKFEL